MVAEADEKLLLNIQNGLLGQVTSELRSVSADINLDLNLITIQFVFSRMPSDSERDAASIAGTNVIAAYPAAWRIDERFLIIPPSESMPHLRLLAFHRCEDEWVSPET